MVSALQSLQSSSEKRHGRCVDKEKTWFLRTLAHPSLGDVRATGRLSPPPLLSGANTAPLPTHPEAKGSCGCR